MPNLKGLERMLDSMIEDMANHIVEGEIEYTFEVSKSKFRHNDNNAYTHRCFAKRVNGKFVGMGTCYSATEDLSLPDKITIKNHAWFHLIDKIREYVANELEIKLLNRMENDSR